MSTSIRLTLSALLATTILALGCCANAGADVFGTISLLSASPFGQAEYAHDPTISEDGSYVVFDGSIAGVPGIWRRATTPGATFEQVAGGDAMLPSVSREGRYVSFTTNEGTSLPSLTNGQAPPAEPQFEAPGVYVRDMSLAPSAAGAFTLASAKNHSDQSLDYEFPGASSEELESKATALGATAAGRSAISADGQTVAFVTTAQSDLAGPGTPPFQVAVRRLESKETQLVSVRYDRATGHPALNPESGEPEPVPLNEGGYGAVWAKTPRFNVRGSSVAEAYEVPQLPGASISADGTTVAWLGQQIGEQAVSLSGEEFALTYAEPLWRRISGGSAEPTRRVTGGSDPESPGCREHPEAKLPETPSPSDPCQGPFAMQRSGGFGTWNDAQEADIIPRLSKDGNDVAFISSAPLASDAGGFGIGGSEYNSDVYWVDMTAPDRVAALRELTHFASGEKGRISTNGNIDDIAISPEGLQVAFTTRRTVFPLGVPAYVSIPAAVPGLAELYDVDLANETLTRVTRGYEGGLPEHPESEEKATEERYGNVSDGALSPSFSAGGEALAFSSTASNLVFGDGNTPINANGDFADGADAFLIPRITFVGEPTPQSISPAPPNPAPEAPWKLIVSASSLADGSVQIRVTVPAPGVLAASASSALPAGAARRGARKVKRTVARARTTAKAGAQSIKLQLKLTGRYRSLANRADGLPGTVTVTFAAAGHSAIHRTLSIRFVRRSHRSRTGKR